MPDPTTPAKGLTQPTVGGDNNTWGALLNAGIALIDNALGGTVAKSISGSTTLLSTDIQNAGYHFTGTLTGNATITWPSYAGMAAIRNDTTGGFSIICGIAGATVTVLAGETVAIWSDGTDFQAAGQSFPIDPVSRSVNVAWYGAKFNGTDDSAAFARAYAAVLPSGTIIIPAGKTLSVASTIQIGNGTTTSISTACSIRIRSDAGGGVGPGEFGSPAFGGCIKWVGSTSASTPVLQLNGPFHDFEISDVLIDCNNAAGIGLDLIHPYQSKFDRACVTNYTNIGWRFRTTGASLFAGITQGCMQNFSTMCEASHAASSTAIGLQLQGDATNNVGCSRNVFIGGRFEGGGGSGSAGVNLIYCDNNLWMGSFIFNSGGQPGVTGTPNGLFPSEDTFIGCPIIGGIQQSPDSAGTGGIMCIPYPIEDGEPPPNFGYNIRALATNGVFYGGVAGSVLTWSGGTDPGTGLTSSTEYFSPIGITVGNNTFSNRVIAPFPFTMTKLGIYLDNAPGTSATRTFTVYQNGSATALALTFGATDSGYKSVSSGAPGLSFAEGDRVNIQSSSTGSPANGGAEFAISLYPSEVV